MRFFSFSLKIIGIDAAIGCVTGESPAQIVCIATGAVCVAQVAENSYEAFNREHNLKRKDRAYREMKIIVHDAEVSRLKKTKTLVEEKYYVEKKDESK